jgi:predicted dehydrogenase
VGDAIEMMSIGCDVLVEKPLACDLQGADEVAAAAARLGRRVFVGCCLRFDAGLRDFRARLGEIGEVQYVRIECQSYLPDWRPGRDYKQSYSASAAQGGVLRDLIHEIDYAVWLFGRPAEVRARLENRGRLGIEAEEAADLLWTVPSGPTVSIRLDYLSRTPHRRMRAFGAAGEIEWDAKAAGANADADAMYAGQLRAFIGASQGKDPGPLATLEDGRFAMWIHDEAKRNAHPRG